MAKTQIIHVAVEPKLKQLLAKHAAQLDAPMGYVIRLALVAYLAEVKQDALGCGRPRKEK